MPLLARFAGFVLAVTVLVLGALGVTASYSPSGWALLGGLALVALDLALAPRLGSRRADVGRGGLALVALVLVTRAALAGCGTTSLAVLPGAAATRWTARFFDEQDASLLGARALRWIWPMPTTERAQLVPAMQGAFVAMRASEGTTPSPMLDTVLGRQRPDAFDTIVIEPRTDTPRAAVVFLHGYAGSSTLECWMIAEAARAIDALTVCPSTGFAGQWWTEDGVRTLRTALAYVEKRRIDRIYLAGLSNGGIGAARLARRFAGSLDGLILISGVAPDGSTAGLPTLVVQGAEDATLSAEGARAFVARTGATYVELAGGHFVMMVRRTEVRDTIAAWLKGRRTPVARTIAR
jgi:hypothetical protein